MPYIRGFMSCAFCGQYQPEYALNNERHIRQGFSFCVAGCINDIKLS
uniref:Uncharacterized protein n=1 Tax=Anguilla anguilla TaxID=7936 RepID=A0A0E9X3L1_ANGAN